MFESFTLKNFCTHKDTEIELYGPVALFIGNNSSGKTNFLKGIHFMSKIASQARPRDGEIDTIKEKTKIKRKDFNAFYYRWANGEPMELSCKWKDREENTVEYKILISTLKDKIVGKESIFIKPKGDKEEFSTETEENEYLDLRLRINQEDINPEVKKIASRFFADLGLICLYHFQPYVLKSISTPIQDLMKDKERLSLPWALQKEGENFIEIIGYIRDNEKKVYDKMISFLRIIDEKFESVRKENSHLRWFYKPRKSSPKLYNFTTEQISDGFIKCAAISLLVSLDKAPSLIMLEEIENGINPLYIKHIISWLYQAAGEKDSISRGYITQFILTTHSPIVLREFVDNLNCVYTFKRMDKNFESKVNNLQEVIKTFIEVGTIEGEIDNGKVIITRDDLESLWLDGLIGD